MRRLLLAILLLLAPASAWAATCTCADESFSVGAITDAGGWDGGCSPSAGDSFTINSGCTVTITGTPAAMAQDTTASIGWTVNAGGSLIIQSADSQVGLTLGDLGLVTASGSSLQLGASYRTLGTSSIWAGTLSTESYWQVPDVVPCPGGDCTLMRFQWPTARYNTASGTALDVGVDESIGSGASGIGTSDVLCLFRPTTDATWGSPEDSMCYPVAAASNSGTPYIDLKVRVAPNQPVPNAQQDVVTGTLPATLVKGSRTVTVPEAAVVSGGEKYLVGKWIRFEAGSTAVYEPQGYMILSASDPDSGAGADDTLTLASVDGLQFDYPSGSDFSIDYGWRTGDPFFVMRPAKLASATSTYADSPVRIGGTFYGSGFHLEKLREFTFTGSGFYAPDWIENGFVQETDYTTTAGQILRLENLAGQTIRMRRMALVGGDTSGAANQTQHGVLIRRTAGTPSVFLTMEDVTIRYMGDDCLVVDQIYGGSATLNRIKCQWMADGGDSAQFWDDTTNNQGFDLTVNGGLCLDCTGSGGSSVEAAITHSGNGVISLSGVTFFGLRGGGVARASFASLANLEASNIAVIGGGSARTGQWMLPKMNHFVVRDVAMTGSGSYGYNDSVGANAADLRNGLIDTVSSTGTDYLFQITTPGAPASLYQNLAVVDYINARGAARTFSIASTPSGTVFENLTLAYRPSIAPTNRVLVGYYLIDDSPLYTFRQNIASGITRAVSGAGLQATSDAYFSGITDRGKLCLFDNTNDLVSINASSLTSDSVRARPLGLFRPLRGLNAVIPGSLAATYGCGANTRAGITRYLWMHSVTGLTPESAGTVGLGGGGGGWPRAY